MSQDPGRIGDTVEAIRGTVSDTVTSATGTIGNVAANARDCVQNALPSASPFGLAIGAFAVGFVVGLCVPVSDVERKRMGPIGEQMSERARSAAADAIEQGKAAVTQAIGDVMSGTPLDASLTNPTVSQQ